MFREADALSNIVSDTVKTLFKRQLVDRVLRLPTEMAHGGRFPRRDQFEPSTLGADWASCLLIAVQSPAQLSYFVAVGEDLSFAHCPNDSLAGVLPSHLPQVLSARRCLMLDGADLSDANLDGAEGLTQAQLDRAHCNNGTKLPTGLTGVEDAK